VLTNGDASVGEPLRGVHAKVVAAALDHEAAGLDAEDLCGENHKPASTWTPEDIVGKVRVWEQRHRAGSRGCQRRGRAGRHERDGHRLVLDPPEQVVGVDPEPAVGPGVTVHAVVAVRLHVLIAVDNHRDVARHSRMRCRASPVVAEDLPAGILAGAALRPSAGAAGASPPCA